MRNPYFLERRAARAFALKDYEKAIDALSDLLSVVGENANTLHAAAVCHQRLGHHDAAIGFASRGLSANPVHLGCLEVLAESHVACGDPDTAREFARRALERVDSMNTAETASATLAGRFSSLLSPVRVAAGNRSSSPEWQIWAKGLLNNQPEVGKS